MGHCFCVPSKQITVNEASEEGMLKTYKNKEQGISTPTSNHSKNQTPKHEKMALYDGAANKSCGTKIIENNNEDEDDMSSVSQIFVRNENENLDSENIKIQSRIRMEDFKLLKVPILLHRSSKKTIRFKR